MSDIRFLNARDVRELLPYDACIEVVRKAMITVSVGGAHLPLRQLMRLPTGNGALGMMPGYLSDPACFGIKLVSLFPANHAAGRSSHLGLSVLYEAEFGQPVAILDGATITAIRTAAASTVATLALARPDASTLGIIGTGEQAESHIRAMYATKRFDACWVWGRSAEHATALVKELTSAGFKGLRTAGSISEVIARADVVCTVTGSPEPILRGADLREGLHLCLVGASLPQFREVDDECVKRSRFFVDLRASAFAQAGELLHAIQEGVVTESHVLGEIGEVLAGTKPGRTNAREITVYKSLGIAAQDLAAGAYVHQQAVALNRGTVLRL